MDFERKYLIYKNKYLTKKLKLLKGGYQEPEYPLENETKTFVLSLADKPKINELTISEARKVLKDIQHDKSYLDYVDITEIDDENNRLKIFRPKNVHYSLPIVMYYHGGGWILGDYETHGRLMSEIAINANVAVVYVGYTLAPEAKYPKQLIQGYKAMAYIYENADKFGLNKKIIMLAGDGVGGNMAISMGIMAGKIMKPVNFKIKISSLILMYPVTNGLMNTESYEIYKNGPWLTKDSMTWFFDNYASELERSKPGITVNDNEIPEINDVLIITAENDVLRDHGEMYARKLEASKVNVTSVRFDGTIHDFLMLDPLKNTPAIKAALQLIISFIIEVVAAKMA